MRILIYKRTHTGDPDESGRFGCYRCMRSVRGGCGLSGARVFPGIWQPKNGILAGLGLPVPLPRWTYARAIGKTPKNPGNRAHQRDRTLRGWDFDAVIGVGGIGPEPVEEGIDRKITWIGIGPKEVGVAVDGFPILAFEQFYIRDKKGPLLTCRAPKLARRLFKTDAPRKLMIDSDLSEEIRAVLKLAGNAPPSPALLGQAPKPRRCKRSQKKRC